MVLEHSALIWPIIFTGLAPLFIWLLRGNINAREGVSFAGGVLTFGTDVTQVIIGGMKIGITGLKAAIEELRALKGHPDPEIAQALCALLKPQNYIPAAAASEYRQAFLREFKKALGEPVAEEPGGLTIQILGMGCPACDALTQMVMNLLTEMRLPAAVERVTEAREIAALGVFSFPALLINGRLRAAGRMPDRETLKEWLAKLNPPAAP